MRHTIWMVAAILAASVPVSGDALRLVPMPKEVRRGQGVFRLDRALVLELPEASIRVLGPMVQGELKLAGMDPPKIVARRGGGFVVRLASRDGSQAAVPAPPKKLGAEGYELTVRPDEVVCAAPQAAGLFYGVQTLRQLIRANRVAGGKALGCVTVCDWPALRWRCFQDDLTRGPSSRLTTMRKDVDLGAMLKMNVWTYYMEYQYAFKKHPKIGPKDGSLTPKDLAALVAYAKPLHVEVMGNQQSFGHFGHILAHEEYADLRETRSLLTPANEKTYQLLDDLYSEVIPLLPFTFFNVCCDETWGLGKGPSKDMAKKIGVGGVYVRHIRRVYDLVKGKYGKRMMMWGDIILQHRGNLKAIPKDVIMLTWGYGNRASFEDQIRPFAVSGYEFFVCPGVSNWSRILPDFGVATTNIRNFVRDGVKHGAIGMLNTAWEDDGEALNAPKWHAHAWAAECAWTGSATTDKDFNRRIGAVLFGEKGDHFGQAIELLAGTHRLAGMTGMNNRRFWQDDFTPRGAPAAVRAQATRLLALVEPAIEHLEACRKQAVVNAELLDHFLQGARRMELIGRRMLDGVAVAELYSKACSTPREEAKALVEKARGLVVKNRDATEALGKEFRRLWLIESKPYALDRTMSRYDAAVKRYEVMAANLAKAAKALQQGKPLPDPHKLRLDLPEAILRRTRPHRLVATPLKATGPWTQKDATHRIGLVVHAGKTDRRDLPIELDVSVPADLSGKPVRAFRLGGGEEIPVQFDAAGRRLSVLLSGKLPRGAAAEIYVYLGLKTRPAPRKGAVTTGKAPGGMTWIENDKVRLLLGPQGAHVFEWRVKARQGRDLAMPGRGGWAGFSDMALGYRDVPFKLECLAAGPAVVTVRCTAANGMVKTIRLHAGVSWMEVFVSEPTGHYWDFDDPKNFAADGPTPGKYLFSNGKTGPVGRAADGVPAQVRVSKVHWGVKFSPDRLGMGLVTPEVAAAFRVAPGAGAGGVGIERSPAASHFITFAGVLDAPPAETMDALRQTLNLRDQPEVVLHAIQKR